MDRTHDRQLIARLQSRDETAVAELAERYSSRIYQLALRHTKNREDAEEVTQDVFRRVAEKIHEFESQPRPGSFRTWLSNLTRWRIIDKFRAQRPPREEHQATLRFADGGEVVLTGADADRAISALEDFAGYPQADSP